MEVTATHATYREVLCTAHRKLQPVRPDGQLHDAMKKTLFALGAFLICGSCSAMHDSCWIISNLVGPAIYQNKGYALEADKMSGPITLTFQGERAHASGDDAPSFAWAITWLSAPPMATHSQCQRPIKSTRFLGPHSIRNHWSQEARFRT